MRLSSRPCCTHRRCTALGLLPQHAVDGVYAVDVIHLSNVLASRPV